MRSHNVSGKSTRPLWRRCGAEMDGVYPVTTRVCYTL